VYFEAQNNGNLLEGAYAEFYLKIRALENAIVVPKTAIIEEQGRYFVYVQASGETYRKREIFVADSDGLKTRVEKGLSAGERVVTRGSMLLKTASVSPAIPVHDHEH
jgi:multidrug efflux pump subunit AcrA (membrane-fusion protein)